MGKKGRQSAGVSGAHGHGKGAGLGNYIKQQQLASHSLQQQQQLQQLQQLRPRVDVARFERILRTQTLDQNDQQIQLSTPFNTTLCADMLIARKRAEEARQSDAEFFSSTRLCVVNKVVPSLQELCLRELSRHAEHISDDARRELESLPVSTLSRLSQYACQNKTSSKSFIEWLALVRPAIESLFVGELCRGEDVLNALLSNPALQPLTLAGGPVPASWETVDWDQVGCGPFIGASCSDKADWDVLRVPQPLASTLVELTLVGCRFTSDSAMASLGHFCSALRRLTIHRLSIVGGGPRWLSEHLLLPARLWDHSGVASAAAAVSALATKDNKTDDHDECDDRERGVAKQDVGIGDVAANEEPPRAWLALEQLFISHCPNCGVDALEILAHRLATGVHRHLARSLPVLSFIQVHPPLPADDHDHLQLIFSRAHIDFQNGSPRGASKSRKK